MLASNFFFWDWSGAPVYVPPPPPPDSGHSTGHAKPDIAYTPLTEEEWLAREERMRASLPTPDTPETVAEKRLRYVQEVKLYQQQDAQLAQMRAQLDALLQQLRTAPSPEALTQIADAVSQLRVQTGTLDNAHRAHAVRLKSLRFQLLN
jgi:hypothetical protein